jgi:hypothetical protein
VSQQLHPGETALGEFHLSLDPLLPLWFDRERFAEDAFTLPFRYLWDGFRAVTAAMAPPFLRELLSLDTRYRRRYGFYPATRLYRAVRRPLHGGSWHGGRESLAGRLWRAVHESPWHPSPKFDDFTLVLTDRRLLALRRVRNTEPVVIFELPRGSYGLRPEQPNSWRTKRIDLAFSDGSWIALSAGTWFFGYSDNEKARVPAITTLLR